MAKHKWVCVAGDSDKMCPIVHVVQYISLFWRVCTYHETLLG